MNTRPPLLPASVRARFPTAGITGMLAAAVWVLSGCAGPYPNDRPAPTVRQPYPQSYPQTYPYGDQGSRQRDYRRGPNERLFEARVTSVRAVLVAGSQRCWMEREAVPQSRAGTNMPGALAGAVIGGILGHQVGGGSGRDLATVGGVVAGAAVGSQVGRQPQGGGGYTQEVQRCSDNSGREQVDHWDVTYDYRGITHRTQMTSPPGATVTVNADGEPRE